METDLSTFRADSVGASTVIVASSSSEDFGIAAREERVRLWVWRISAIGKSTAELVVGAGDGNVNASLDGPTAELRVDRLGAILMVRVRGELTVAAA